MKRTYEIRKNLILKRTKHNLIFFSIGLIIIFAQAILGEAKLILSIFFIPNLISLLIFANHYFTDKKQKISINNVNKTINIFNESKMEQIKFYEIKKIYSIKGKKDDTISYSLPHMFHHYYKICTADRVFTITNLSYEKIVFPKNIEMAEKITFLNFVNNRNTWIKENEKLERINLEQTKIVERFVKKFQNKSELELKQIIDSNKNNFTDNAIKAAMIVLKEKAS